MLDKPKFHPKKAYDMIKIYFYKIYLYQNLLILFFLFNYQSSNYQALYPYDKCLYYEDNIRHQLVVKLTYANFIHYMLVLEIVEV